MKMLWPLIERPVAGTPFNDGNVGDPRKSSKDGTLRFHAGVDLAASPGEAIVSPVDGAVKLSGWRPGRKAMFIIGDDYTVVVAPVIADEVTEGPVGVGQVAGYADPYGKVPHVHVEVWAGKVTPGARKKRVEQAGAGRPAGLLDTPTWTIEPLPPEEPGQSQEEDKDMNIISYAIALSTLARWTAGSATDEAAQAAWEDLAAAGYAQGAADKESWPTMVRSPANKDETWTWGTLAASLGPLGFLVGLIGDDAVADQLAENVNAGKAVVEGAARAGAGLLPLLALAGVGVVIVALVAASRK